MTTGMLKLLLGATLLLAPAFAATFSGSVLDPDGQPVAAATVWLGSAEATADDAGRYSIANVTPGAYALEARSPGFEPLRQTVTVTGDVHLDLRFTHLAAHAEVVTVTADATSTGILSPDPSQRVWVRDEMLESSGRPGVPFSIPGVPVETASGGIKAPQYFAPGVAGDHGEPIAQFFQVGGFLLPNNLSANAHGNGYADPNVIIPAVIESVATDGGAFNALEGNHAVSLATVYGFRSRLEPFVTLTGDSRDVDVAAGWSPGDPGTRAWLAIEAAYGNGFLDTLEHRRQYKFNAYRIFDLGSHQLTLLGMGYFGASRVPGLVPINVPNLHDTIDPRQRDQTHSGELAVSDLWRATPEGQLQLSGFFRTYNLALDSDFGDGLIRQSEFRTVTGGEGNYIRKLSESFSFMAGTDYTRDAPRRLDLDHYLSGNPAVYGPFTPVTANNVTLGLISPFAALEGSPFPWLRFNAAWRRDQISFDNTDLLHAENSFNRGVGVNSPKASLTLLPPESLPLPSVSLSYGQTFFTNDPRLGVGTAAGTLVSRAHAYQLVASKMIAGTDFRVTLGHLTQEQSLAKIDPDTGLQYSEGPSRNRYITLAAKHYFRGAMLEASYSQADARELSTGLPLPEAPRSIVDLLGILDRLPFRLHARAEFEQVGRKPLGEGFVSVPVREFRGALAREFHNGRMEAGVNFMIANGFTGQTTEMLAGVERITGVYMPSYVSASFTYHFRPH